MSTFITQRDYTALIHPNILDRITNPQPSLLDDCENMAIEFMRGYLAARYDVATIFRMEDEERNPILVKYAIDITLSYLYNRISPDAIPQARKDNYDAAERWLRRVQQCEINPPDLPRITDGTKDYVLHGSNPKRTNHLT